MLFVPSGWHSSFASPLGACLSRASSICWQRRRRAMAMAIASHLSLSSATALRHRCPPALITYGGLRGMRSPFLSLFLGGAISTLVYSVVVWSGVWQRGSNGRILPGAWTSNQYWGGINRRSSIATITQAALQIDLVPCLVDNYAYLLHDTVSGTTGIVDPSASGPVIKALKAKGLSLDYILNTHHHWDHTGGNADLKKEYNAKVVGPRADQERIPGIDIALRDGETWMFGEQPMRVLDTPGHTRGHVSFYFEKNKSVFTGDTLFSIGCGRLFEGSPEQMWLSLSKLAALPDDTLVYCGHEYTMSNAKFALTVEPQNGALQSRAQKVKELRQKGLPTIPTTLQEEKEFNPFLRPFSAELRKSLKVAASASNIDAFAAVRAAKDRA